MLCCWGSSIYSGQGFFDILSSKFFPPKSLFPFISNFSKFSNFPQKVSIKKPEKVVDDPSNQHPIPQTICFILLSKISRKSEVIAGYVCFYPQFFRIIWFNWNLHWMVSGVFAGRGWILLEILHKCFFSSRKFWWLIQQQVFSEISQQMSCLVRYTWMHL